MIHSVLKIIYLHRVAILVEKKTGIGERCILAVKGHINNGMSYIVEYPSDNPEEPDGYSQKQLVGIVSDTNLLMFAEVCESIDPPKRQYNRHGRKLYLDILIRRSKEWAEATVLALSDQGIFESPGNALLN
jgi:hypothetical protein